VPLDAELLHQARTAKARAEATDAWPESDLARTEFIRALRRLHLAGGSAHEIADTLGLPHQLVNDIVTVQPASSRELLSCSFCGKKQNQIKKMIHGQSKHICNECIDRAHTVLSTVGATAHTPIATIRQVDDAEVARRCSFCGKHGRRVEAMISTDRARICRECIELCDELMTEGPYYSLGKDHLGPA